MQKRSNFQNLKNSIPGRRSLYIWVTEWPDQRGQYYQLAFRNNWNGNARRKNEKASKTECIWFSAPGDLVQEFIEGVIAHPQLENLSTTIRSPETEPSSSELKESLPKTRKGEKKGYFTDKTLKTSVKILFTIDVPKPKELTLMMATPNSRSTFHI